ncbi:DNA mismatch repair protein MutS [Portunus trituberculatus]|uniref:DNA mismatch repair protein MutS n=1 Tax=Portunus trituberculatus TaxID=210409 RepID=A0A5B7IAY0_PORTR|nr:DNA mismatch repair protein MutS [Portunus trituberculatus]
MNEVAHMMVSTDERGRRGGGSGGELAGAGADSLVLLDELGSGTSLEEGGALAWAVVEALSHVGATTILVTHTLFLTRLATLYPNVTKYVKLG